MTDKHVRCIEAPNGRRAQVSALIAECAAKRIPIGSEAYRALVLALPKLPRVALCGRPLAAHEHAFTRKSHHVSTKHGPLKGCPECVEKIGAVTV